MESTRPHNGPLSSCGTKGILTWGIVAFGILGIGWFIANSQISSWDFRNNLWQPAQWLVHGQSPYALSAITDSASLWFPMVIGLLFPLGWLSLYQASSVWLILSLAALVAMVWLSAGASRPALVPFAPALVAGFLFPPSVSHLVLGQFSIAAALLLIVATYSLRSFPISVAAFLVAVAFSKPQLGVLALPGILISVGRHHGITAVLRFMGVMALSVATLTIPLFFAYPDWHREFVISLVRNPTWLQPSLITLLPRVFAVPGLLLSGVIAVAVLGLNTWIWLNLPRRRAILWSLALTPIITPYVWSWDFIVLIPVFAYSVFRLKRVGAQALLWTGYLLCWGLIVRMAYGPDVSDHLHWWVPWLLLLALGGAHAIQNKAVPRLFLGDGAA